MGTVLCFSPTIDCKHGMNILRLLAHATKGITDEVVDCWHSVLLADWFRVVQSILNKNLSKHSHSCFILHLMRLSVSFLV